MTEAANIQPVRHALELRNELVSDPRVIDLLRQEAVAMVISDGAGHWPTSDELTTDFSYVRLHGSRDLYASDYTSEELRAWADRIAKWTAQGCDCFVYFDNDTHAHAPRNAMSLRGYVGN
jgi:uncharacterized protein YecE (DUF72 family)